MKKLNISYLLGGGVILTLFYFLFRKGNPTGSDFKFNNMNTGGFSSLSGQQLEAIAKAQFDSMTVIGTQEGVFTSLASLSADDLKGVYNAFKTRKYLGASGTGFLAEWFGHDLDLFGWYREELSGAKLEKMRLIWTSKNIKITF